MGTKNRGKSAPLILFSPADTLWKCIVGRRFEATDDKQVPPIGVGHEEHMDNLSFSF
jgi:hypothetical protein